MHDVVIERDGYLHRLLGKDRIRVNSLHGQGVERLAPNVSVEARAPDGVIEAFRVTQAPSFALRGAVASRVEIDDESGIASDVQGVRRRRAPRARLRAQKSRKKVPMTSKIQQFFKEHGIQEVEATIPDMAGIARGKVMPAEKFAEDEGMRLPEAIFLQTVTGDYPDDDSAISPSEIDIVLKADPNAISVVPWAAEPTAQVIHDCFYSDGRPVTMAPRYVLQHVLELYAQHGWEPVVAPELEFFLIEPNTDSDYPLKPPIGRSGRPEIGRQSYSIAAVNEFDPVFDDMYAFCEAQELAIDTLIHEAGAAQMEINLLHGHPLLLADQAFLFKRTAREVALRHKMYATFMAKPHAREPGSAMHLHQSIIDKKTGPEYLFQSGWLANAALLLPHRGPAEVSRSGDVALCPEREFLSAHHAAQLGADQRALGL